MARGMWVRDPHAGGVKIPTDVKARTTERIQRHAEQHYAGKFVRLDIRFQGAFCYIDAFTEPQPPDKRLLELRGQTREQYYESMRNLPTHLCRLRYFGDEEAWSLGFFAYSSEKYEPCMFENGEFHGPPEAAFDVGAMYLDE